MLQTAPDDAWDAAELAGIDHGIREMLGIQTVISESQGGFFAEQIARQRLDTEGERTDGNRPE